MLARVGGAGAHVALGRWPFWAGQMWPVGSSGLPHRGHSGRPLATTWEPWRARTRSWGRVTNSRTSTGSGSSAGSSSSVGLELGGHHHHPVPLGVVAERQLPDPEVRLQRRGQGQLAGLGRRRLARVLGPVGGQLGQPGLEALGQPPHLLLLDQQGDLVGPGGGLEVEGALAGLADRVGGQPGDRVEVTARHRPPPPSSWPGPGPLGRGQVGVAAGVVQPHQEGRRPEGERGHAGRADHQPLEQVQVHPQVVAGQRLDDVGVAADGHRLLGMGLAQPLHRLHGPGLHLEQRLPGGEAGRRRGGLHHLPEGLLGQLLERPPGPVPVADLAHVVQGLDLEPLGLGQRGRRLLAALQRAGVDRVQRHRRQPPGQRLGLLPPRLRQVQPRQPPRQPRPGVLGHRMS